MRIFEYPYVIIFILVVCLVVLGGIGIYFAMKGVKETEEKGDSDFSNIKKIENTFYKWGKNGEERSVTYISVSLEKARRLYTDSEVSYIYEKIKPIFLKCFDDEENGAIASCDKENFVALNKGDIKTTIEKTEKCISKIKLCLSELNAINTVKVRLGLYSAAAFNITFDDAIERAKQACIMADTKNVGYTLWKSSEGKSLKKKIEIEQSIENQIDKNRFFLEFQPVLDAKTRKIIGAEVLSRLNSEEDGIISPGTFMTAIESVGLSKKFDYYIFEKLCKWVSNDKGQRERYRYTVNFSRVTLSDSGFVERISEIAERYGIKYSTLAIEVLEDKEVTDEAKKQIIDNLFELRKKGMSVLLDDFGSGYTSFDDLQSLPIDIIKIDRKITKNTDTVTGLAIFKNIVNTARDIGVKTVCEGIETEEQAKMATDADCDILQGFYFYRPVSVVALEGLFKENDI